jgi:hypothetical protein
LAVATTIQAHAPLARFLSIPVFQGLLAASVADLIAALDAAAASPADLVHCSLGMARNDAGVSRAVALLAGRIVVASAPARGAPVWPAALPEVIAVMGDARCDPGQWSRLGLPAADYGACQRAPGGSGPAGASIAAARVTGILAAAGTVGTVAARAHLDAGARFMGREHRLV